MMFDWLTKEEWLEYIHTPYFVEDEDKWKLTYWTRTEDICEEEEEW